MREFIVSRCREFVRQQSEGEWDDKTINSDAERMANMVQEIMKACEPGHLYDAERHSSMHSGV